MRDGGRIAAAIEVLADIETRHKPARLALKVWGDGARYAGAKDRAFVSGLVLDVLRHRRSLAAAMGEETDRARVLAALRRLWDWPAARIAAAAEETHGPGALSADEAARLESPLVADDAATAGDYPAWLEPQMVRAFGDARAEEGRALAARAPVDLRVNTLKTDLGHVIKALETFGPQTLDLAPNALRIPAPAASERAAPVEASPAFEKGWFEVQDLGSQIAATCAGEIKGKQVLDFCAGGGGKTLALAAAMANTGQLYAYDADARRLKETVARAQRAGVRNLQVRSPIEKDPLRGLEGKMDLVFVDSPCTGSGTWRRHPDAKWRLTPQQLERRMAEQDAVLVAAAPFVKPGGRLIYVTCSVFVEENEDRVAAFLSHAEGIAVRPASGVADEFLTPEGFLRLSPRTAGADGFFVAALERS
ncbi:MAG TPA: RsmB/NOP family class I SAM-dependent RNA methyltransferase [Caulobacteraceae bacterium]|nr:RsmB/NOP family class I SAM-dependent RNA methyltransferase [Caulobacteraceae bacterium]